jgi:hypothetical protein
MPHPLAMDHLPGINPRDHAVESRSWGDEFTFYLVSYEGRHYAWTVRPWDDGDQAYEMPSLDAARGFLDAEFAFLLMSTDWGERVASVSVGDYATGQVLFSADVLDGAEDGIWLATSEADGEESSWALAGFGDLGQAVEAFAARTEQAASRVERLDVGWPQVAARYLRYRAAFARSGAARATLGDTIRGSRGRIRAERAVSRVAATVGVSREFLYHVLAGDDWAWKGLTPARKDVLPQRPPARLDPATFEPPATAPGWSARVMLAIEAASEEQARASASTVLDPMGVGATVTGPVAGALPDGLWAVQADIEFPAMTLEPDDAGTRLSYLTGHLGGVTWTGKAGEQHGRYDWPPNIWSRQPGVTEVLGHPAIRAASIQVTADEARSPADGATGDGPG